MTKDRLTKSEIIELLPHREPMLLIDELINIKYRDGRKNFKLFKVYSWAQ